MWLEADLISPTERMEHDPELLGIARKLTPEQELLRAMLEETIKDLFRTPCGRDDDRPREAALWIFGVPRPGWSIWPYGDFIACCQALGIDHDALRTKLRGDLAVRKAS